MAEGVNDQINSTINWHFKQDIIRITVDVPGLKTTVVGLDGLHLKRKPDSRHCLLNVSFDDNKVTLNAELLSGTANGTKYNMSMDKEDLNCGRIMPHPQSYYKVKDDIVEIFVKKR